MNRFALPLGIFAVLVVIFAIALKRAPEKTVIPSALIGKPAPAFVLPDLLKPGENVDSKTFDGQWRLVNVWATWCQECYYEHPVLMKISQGGKVAVIGLNYRDEDQKARDWLAELGNPYAAVAVDKEGNAAIDLGVYGAPETFLIDPKGVIVQKIVGQITEQHWREKLQPLVEGTP